MAQKQIKGCPFCGGFAIIKTYPDPNPDVGFSPDPKGVECTTCHASIVKHGWVKEDDLIDTWNKRVTESVITKAK